MALLKRNSKHIKTILSLRNIDQDALIGKGKFSLVYQDPTFEDVVVKISGDKLSHEYLQLSGKHLPSRISTDYTATETIDGREIFIAVNRVEKLHNVREFRETAKMARHLIKDIGHARSQFIFDSKLSDAAVNRNTLRKVASYECYPASIRNALHQLADFAGKRPHCGLDFHINNFMATSDGSLVFSDPFQCCVTK